MCSLCQITSFSLHWRQLSCNLTITHLPCSHLITVHLFAFRIQIARCFWWANFSDVLPFLVLKTRTKSPITAGLTSEINLLAQVCATDDRQQYKILLYVGVGYIYLVMTQNKYHSFSSLNMCHLSFHKQKRFSHLVSFRHKQWWGPASLAELRTLWLTMGRELFLFVQGHFVIFNMYLLTKHHNIAALKSLKWILKFTYFLQNVSGCLVLSTSDI